MSDAMEMPKYRCHKVVHALKIAKVLHLEKTGAGIGQTATVLVPVDQRYGDIMVDNEYMAKHKPKEGGYYVVYEDGYKSFSPAEAFEAGYTLIK